MGRQGCLQRTSEGGCCPIMGLCCRQMSSNFLCEPSLRVAPRANCPAQNPTTSHLKRTGNFLRFSGTSKVQHCFIMEITKQVRIFSWIIPCRSCDTRAHRKIPEARRKAAARSLQKELQAENCNMVRNFQVPCS